MVIKKKVLLSLFWLLIFGSSLFLPSFVLAQSASLYLSPSSGIFAAGSSFSVAVKVDTGGIVINAVQGTLAFDPKKLAVVNVSKAGTIFTLWMQEPTFSNTEGTIRFGGGVPNPGFSGASGTILIATFRAKTAGKGVVNFSSASVLANDGLGTNILSFLGGGTYEIVLAAIVLPTGDGRPVQPAVSSPTHPNKDEWYANDDPEFIWALPSDVTSISYALDQNPDTNPSFIAADLSQRKTFSDIEDGTWYFHINFRNKAGWGAFTHYRVLIDTTPPLPFEITVDDRGDPAHPQPTLYFATSDEMSGVSHYEIQIDNHEMIVVSLEEAEIPFVPEPQVSGKREVTVSAVDGAGNRQSAAVTIGIVGAPPSFTFTVLGGLFADTRTILLFFLFLLTLFIGYEWFRFRRWRAKLLKEAREAERVAHKAFDALHEDLTEQFKLLEKTRKSRKLTKAEEKLYRSVQKNLSIAEKFIRKEIKDVEKELK